MKKIEDYKREILFILFSQKKLIVRVTLVSFITAFLIAFFWPATYEATGSIILKGKKMEKGPDVLERADIRPTPTSIEDVLSEVEILTSNDVSQKTVDALRSKEMDTSLKTRVLGTLGSGNAIKKKLKVEIVPGSNVIKVSFLSYDYRVSLAILDELMHQYVSYRNSVFNPAQEEVFYTVQLDKFSQALSLKNEDLMQLIARSGVSQPEREMENNSLIKKELESQLQGYKIQIAEKNADVEYLANILSQKQIHHFSFKNYELRQDRIFNDKLSDLYFERSHALRNYKTASDRVQSVESQIDGLLRTEIVGLSQSLLHELRTMERAALEIESRVTDLESENRVLAKQVLETERLKSEWALLNESYQNFYKRNEAAKINSSITRSHLPSYIGILSHAHASDKPIYPVKVVVIPLGLLMGLIMGFSLAFLKEFLDHTFKKPDQVTEFTNLPVLFSIPEIQG